MDALLSDDPRCHDQHSGPSYLHTGAVLHHYWSHPEHRSELGQEVCMQCVHEMTHQVIPVPRFG